MNIFADVDELPLLIEKGCLVSFLNPFSYSALQQYPLLLKKIDCFGFDGVALQLMYQWLSRQKVSRISFDFTSVADSVFHFCEANNKTLAVIGSTESAIGVFHAVLLERYPKLKICYRRDGYMSPLERPLVINDVVAAAPDIVVCGMGSVLQENFLIDLRAAGWSGAGFTCGGFIHQTASTGGVYYPAWINRCNLRFVYRMWDEPKLIKRYLIDYPKGMWRFYRDFCRA